MNGNTQYLNRIKTHLLRARKSQNGREGHWQNLLDRWNEIQKLTRKIAATNQPDSSDVSNLKTYYGGPARAGLKAPLSIKKK